MVQTTDSVPVDWLPLLTWPYFFYDQQWEYIESDTNEVWFIGGNGTGKTLILYWSIVAHLLGAHPKPLGKPPIRARILVPSFDNVEKVALDKLLLNQRVVLPKVLSEKQEKWVEVLKEYDALKEFKPRAGWMEIGPILPQSALKTDRGFKKEHRGIELINGSSIWWVTTEQGWMSMRGAEQDIEGVDEECGWDEFNQVKRGLRNAKGGGRIYGALTPPYKEGQGPTWTKEKVVDAKSDKVTVINASMADNPAITAEYIEWWTQGKTKKQIDVEVYGKYPTWGDLVHPDFQERVWDPKKVDGHLLPNDFPMPDAYDVDWVMAFDWHQSKPCAAVFGWIDSDKNLTIFDELDKDVAEDKTIDDLADIFRNIEGHPYYKRKFQRWQDPSAKAKYKAVQRGFNAWDAFRKAGIITSAGKNRDQLVGISIVNEYFRGNSREEPRIFIYERCKYLRQYLSNHYWKRGEDGIGKPDPKWSDYPICVRYILQEVGWKKSRKRQKKWPFQSFQANKPEKPTISLYGLDK